MHKLKLLPVDCNSAHMSSQFLMTSRWWVALPWRSQPAQCSCDTWQSCTRSDCTLLAGLLALRRFHGVATSGWYEPNDLEVAEDVHADMFYEMYRSMLTGLSPEIMFFT